MKKTHKAFICIILSFAAFAMTGCEKALETKVYTQITPVNFFKTEGDFNAAVIALYSPFTTNWGGVDGGDNVWYAALYNTNEKTYFIQSMLSTDELNTNWTRTVADFTYGPATFQGDQAPTYAKIRFVARATGVIYNIEHSTGATQAIRDKYVAEAKCLRAWLMYVLYDFYGPLNVKLDPATLNDTTITPRLSKEAYCGAIEQDLKDALATNSFPERYNDDPANWGRMSKGVARMLLLKLYMHNKEWAKAEEMGKEIMNMGYTLMDNYADVFNVKANNEIIYAIPASAASPNYWVQHIFPDDYVTNGTISFSNPWYGFYMPWSFYDKFSPQDKRLSTIISSYTNSAGGTSNRANYKLRGAIPVKYTVITGTSPDYTMDLVVFRYAEVLLYVAEAINEQRGPADAYQYVNQVRERAGVSDWSGMTQAEFRDSILDEEARELYCEGTRRQDLIRHGKYISNAIARGKDAKPYQVLFPIPSDVIIEGHGVIKQNPGYPN